MRAERHQDLGRGEAAGPQVVATSDDAVTVDVWSRADLLAVGDHPVADLPVRSLHLVCHDWVAPTPSWTGSWGYVPGVREVRARVVDDGPDRGAHLHLELRWVLPVHRLVAATHGWLYPGLAPSRPHSAAVAAPRERSLAVSTALGSPARRPEAEPEGSGLEAADVVVDVDDDASGPTVDLRVHHPVGRLDPWTPGRRLRLERDGDQWVARDDAAVLRLAPDRPLDEHDVARLRDVESLDVSAAGDVAAAGGRLAELAATGVVLHDAPTTFDGWPAPLARTVAQPYEPATGMVREHRSLTQRRLALAAFDPARAGRVDQFVGAAIREPEVSVLLVSRRPDLALRAIEMIAAQDHRRLEIVVVMHGAPEVDTARLATPHRALVTVNRSVPAGSTLGEALSAAVTASSGELLTKVDDDDFYGPHHVSDLVMARRYSAATMVGRRADHVYVESLDVTVDRSAPSEKYGAPVAGGTMMLSRSDLLAVGGWRPVARSVDRALHRRVIDAGGLVYIASGIGYLYVRHDQGHTWHQPVAPFLQAARAQRDGLRLDVLG